MNASIKKFLRLPYNLKLFPAIFIVVAICFAVTAILVRASYQPDQEVISQVNDQAEQSKENKQSAKTEKKDVQPSEKEAKEVAESETNLGQAGDVPAATPSPEINTETVPPPKLHLPTAPLQMTQSAVTLTSDGFSTHVDVWADGNLELAEPQVTTPAGVRAFVSSSVANRWNIAISQIDPNSSGQGIVKITTNSFTPNFKTYNGQITVTWHPPSLP